MTTFGDGYTYLIEMEMSSDDPSSGFVVHLGTTSGTLYVYMDHPLLEDGSLASPFTFDKLPTDLTDVVLYLYNCDWVAPVADYATITVTSLKLTVVPIT